MNIKVLKCLIIFSSIFFIAVIEIFAIINGIDGKILTFTISTISFLLGLIIKI